MACLVAAVVCLASGVLLLSGCGDTGPVRNPQRPQAATYQKSSDELRQDAMRDLNQLDRYPPNLILEQIVDRLNQWGQGEVVSISWEADPLLAKLPDEFQAAPYLANLGESKFTQLDGFELREAIWCRDVSSVVCAGAFNKKERATRLCDWIARNVLLEAEPGAEVLDPMVQFPWETILFAKGRAIDRAWLFTLLGRQEELDLVVLALPDVSAAGGNRPWAVALVEKDELYLFDMRLGLPIPAADGEGVATLRQVQENPALLRQLDLPDAPYPVASEDISELVVMIEGSPLFLSRRAKMLESRLVSGTRVGLSTRPEKIAREVRDIVGDSTPIQLWDWPYRTLNIRMQPNAVANDISGREMRFFFRRDGSVDSLWAARLLHFRGHLQGEEGGSLRYLESLNFVEGMRKGVAEQAGDKEIPRAFQEAFRQIVLRANLWLGQSNFDTKKYDVASHFFDQRILQVESKGRWVDLARFNLARTYEQQEKFAEAIEVYEQDQSAGRSGSLLRARRLRDQLEADGKPAGEAPLEVDAVKTDAVKSDAVESDESSDE